MSTNRSLVEFMGLVSYWSLLVVPFITGYFGKSGGSLDAINSGILWFQPQVNSGSALLPTTKQTSPLVAAMMTPNPAIATNVPAGNSVKVTLAARNNNRPTTTTITPPQSTTDAEHARRVSKAHYKSQSSSKRVGDNDGDEEEDDGGDDEGQPGYPHPGHRTAHAIGRHNLIELLDKPQFRHPNVDNLPVNVMITLIPLKIQDLVEKQEVIETTIRLQLTWQDKRLAWDPARFSNVSEIVVPATSIWAPDIAVLNSVADVYDVVRDTRFEMKVESSGRIWWHPTGIVKTYCKLYLLYFPFDKQTCSFVFESPTLDVRFMNLTLRSTKQPVDTRMYLEGESWQLLHWGGRNLINKVGAKTYFARVEFFIHIERAKIYHVLNVILPAFFLSAVQVMFFLVPVTHPQRVGSSTTTLLSVVVFQTVAISHLPNTSNDVPLLTIYIFFVVIVSSLSVATSIVVAKFAVYAEQNVDLPAFLARIPHPIDLLSSWKRRPAVASITGLADNEIIGPTTSTNLEFVFVDHQLHQNQQPNSVNNNNNQQQRRLSPSHCKLCVKTSSASAAMAHMPLSPMASLRSDDSLDHPLATRQISNQSYRGQVCGQVGGHEPAGKRPSLLASKWPTVMPAASAYANVAYQPQQPTQAKMLLLASGHRRLFKNWNDVSIFVDVWLMIVAVMISLFSPLVLFFIVPMLADQSYEIALSRKN